MHGDGPDTALARALHEAHALPLPTLQRCLAEVRERNAGGGAATLAGVLIEQRLVAPEVLDELEGRKVESSSQDAGGVLRPGERVAGFEVVREIARGGMGAVYEVRAADGGRYALKTLLLSGLGFDDPDLVERFRRESQIVARLEHPCIVHVLAAELDASPPYLVQELLTGGTLQDRLRKGPLPPDEAAELTIKLAQALEHAHARGVLHRDLKPDNVMLDEHGEPRLVDFGVGLALDMSRMSLTGQIVGTPSFMAPEQAHGIREVDPRTDVYGLGAVLYALLTGDPPFVHSSQLKILEAVACDPPVDPQKRVAAVPRELADVCLRALAKEPGERFPDMRAFAAALRETSGTGGSRKVALIAGAVVAVAALVVGALVLGAESSPTQPVEGDPHATSSPNPEPVVESVWAPEVGEAYPCQMIFATELVRDDGELLPYADLSVILDARVTKVTPEAVRVDATIAAMRASHAPLGGRSVARLKFDSLGPPEENSLQLNGVVGHPASFDLAPDGRVVGVSGMHELNEDVIIPSLKSLLRGMEGLVEQSIGQISNHQFRQYLVLLTAVPPQGIAQREAWVVEETIVRPLLVESPVRAVYTPLGEQRYRIEATSSRADANYSLKGEIRYADGKLQVGWYREFYTGVSQDGALVRLRSHGSYELRDTVEGPWLEDPAAGE